MAEKLNLSPDAQDAAGGGKQNSIERLPFEEELRLLPGLEKGKDLWQNKFHEFDVYDHTLKFVEFIKKIAAESGQPLDPNMVAAAYLHDLGKPAVAQEKLKDGKVQEKEPGKPYHEFETHEVVGAQMVSEMTPDFFVRNGLDQEKVAKLVGAHYIPMKGIKQMRKATNFEEFRGKYKELLDNLDSTGLTREEVMELFLADSYSKGKGCTDFEELMKIRGLVLSGGEEDKLKEVYNLQKATYGGKE